MSSLPRRIARQVVASQPVHVRLDMDGEPIKSSKGGRVLYANPPRKKFYAGRGNRLGITNPNDACTIARKRRAASC